MRVQRSQRQGAARLRAAVRMTAYLIVACIAGGFLCFHDLHGQRSPPSLGLLGRGRVAGAALVARDDRS
jgi:hypothetical protein